MSQLIARILLSCFVFPVGFLLFFVTVLGLDKLLRPRLFDSRSALMATTLVTCLGVGLYWLLIWRSTVRWTSSRVRQTAAASVAALVICVVGGIWIMKGEEEYGLLLGAVLAPIAWLIATVFLWRETAAERIVRLRNANRDNIACPTCGYNMTGLRECRCPECGSQFTLNELLAGQPERAAGELEQ